MSVHSDIAKAREEALRLLRAFAQQEGTGRSIYADLAELVSAARKMIEVEKKYFLSEIHKENAVVVHDIIAKQMAITESFIAEYLKQTGARIEDTMMIERRSSDGCSIHYWFEPKDKN